MIHSYRRVSTDEQQNGPSAQLDAIFGWWQRLHDGATADEFDADHTDFFDDGVSGSVPIADRPAGGRMISVLSAGDTVVVAKLDRLFRSVADAATTIDEWTRRDVKLVSIAEGFDATNPYGKAMCQMASVFAELEREMIRSRTRDALAIKKARGECVGEVPYGWRREGSKLYANPTEYAVIKRIQYLYSCGASYESLAKLLNHENIPAKKGGKWHKTTVQRLVEKEGIYLEKA